MIDYLKLAEAAYAHAEAHYGDKGARFDVIVECMGLQEIAADFERDGITSERAAIAWAKETAGLQHEVELNQAWDGPESCIGSPLYDPKHDPAGPLLGPPFQAIEDADDHGQPVAPWASLAGIQGPAAACICSDDQLNLVGCDCLAHQNLPVRCACQNFLRTQAEINANECRICAEDDRRRQDYCDGREGGHL